MKASATRKTPLHKLRGVAIWLGICVVVLMGQIWAAEAARAKITGIAYVKVKVTDVEKAKAFYGGLLGLASGGVKDGNLVQASFVVNREQRVELTKGAAGTGGSYLVEIGLALFLITLVVNIIAQLMVWSITRGNGQRATA